MIMTSPPQGLFFIFSQHYCILFSLSTAHQCLTPFRFRSFCQICLVLLCCVLHAFFWHPDDSQPSSPSSTSFVRLTLGQSMLHFWVSHCNLKRKCEMWAHTHRHTHTRAVKSLSFSSCSRWKMYKRKQSKTHAKLNICRRKFVFCAHNSFPFQITINCAEHKPSTINMALKHSHLNQQYKSS